MSTLLSLSPLKIRSLHYVAHMRWTQRYGVVAIAIVALLILIFVLQQKRKPPTTAFLERHVHDFVLPSRTLRGANAANDRVLAEPYRLRLAARQ